MSNPYTSVSVASSYNASPPSDDASQVDSNQVEWSKHKTKLSDPLKTAIEAINSNNATAHGLHLGQTFELKTANYPIVAPGDRGKVFSVTGTRTITLPLVATAGDGFPVLVKNDGSGTVTVETTASELIDGSTSFTLVANEWALLTTDGVTWTAVKSTVIRETGSFVVTYQGYASSPTTTWNYTRIGSMVMMSSATTLSDTSDSTSLISTAGDVPISIRPIISMSSAHIVEDNGVEVMGKIVLSAAGTITWNGGIDGSGFTASGAKGFPGLQVFSYFLD